MKHRGLKFLSLLLTLALLVGLLPGMTAFAAGGTVYLKGDTIETGGKEYFISKWSNKDQTSGIWKGVGSKPVVSSFDRAQAKISGEYNGNPSEVVVSEDPTKQETRTPIGVRFVRYNESVPGADANKKAVVMELVYGFTVTYAPGEGSRNNGVDKNPVHIIETDATSVSYTVEPYDQRYFTAPEGKRFDHWENSAGGTPKNGDTINVSQNITLTAIWVPDSKPGSGSGSGGADIVFNVPGVDNSWEYVGGGVPQRAYRVSLAPMQGGSAALGLTTGESGTALNVYPTSAVYVFPNAEQGYVLDKIVWSLIDGSASYDITEAKNFVMPAMDVVVNVTFRPVG